MQQQNNRLGYMDVQILSSIFNSGGYVLDFSNESFRKFVLASLNTDVYEDKFYQNYPSKGKKLECIFEKHSASNVIILVKALLDYANAKSITIPDSEKDKITSIIKKYDSSYVQKTTTATNSVNNFNNEENQNNVNVNDSQRQIRTCLKTGASGCPHSPQEQSSKIFVAMPFDENNQSSFNYGIQLVVNIKGLTAIRADEQYLSRDIMCKICQNIQECSTVIANISGTNANVMLELGFAYGLGKKIVLIKDININTRSLVDLGSNEHIEYENPHDLATKLLKIL